jgi:alcohol dehydrogenase
MALVPLCRRQRILSTRSQFVSIPNVSKIKAAVFLGAGKPLEIQEFPTPQIRLGEIGVSVIGCTICGSDLHTYLGHRSAATPSILGHEMIGRISRIGPGPIPNDLRGIPLSIGDRVAWSIAANCGHCFFCDEGIPQKCEQIFKYGHESTTTGHPLSGGFSEFVHIVSGTHLIKVPDNLPDWVACPATCATATVAAVFRVAGDCYGKSILITGVGMLGLTACAYASTLGAREIIAVDINPQRLALATRFGATYGIHATGESSPLGSSIRHLTGGRGVDRLLEFSGSADAIDAALPLIRIGGRCVLAGPVSPTRPVSIVPESIVRRLLDIRGVHNYLPVDLVSAFHFLEQNHHSFPFHELVEREFPLPEAEAAFQWAIANKAPRVAIRCQY